MKLRIKGNSIRIRLSRSEVDHLAKAGYLDERTEFGTGFFSYALKTRSDISELEAGYHNGIITMYVPADKAANWYNSETVGFENNVDLGNNKTLHLLLEKDFKCLDQSSEDQSDNYENPNKTC